MRINGIFFKYYNYLLEVNDWIPCDVPLKLLFLQLGVVKNKLFIYGRLTSIQNSVKSELNNELWNNKIILRREQFLGERADSSSWDQDKIPIPRGANDIRWKALISLT